MWQTLRKSFGFLDVSVFFVLMKRWPWFLFKKSFYSPQQRLLWHFVTCGFQFHFFSSACILQTKEDENGLSSIIRKKNNWVSGAVSVRNKFSVTTMQNPRIKSNPAAFLLHMYSTLCPENTSHTSLRPIFGADQCWMWDDLSKIQSTRSWIGAPHIPNPLHGSM